jgi:ribosomal protein L12E/L44/L45/RPP1/RPP2
MIKKLPLLMPLAALLVSGCVGSVIKTVVTAPIKAAGAVVDAATTSQEEADRNRGRAARKAEEQEEKDRKKAEKRARKARDS